MGALVWRTYGDLQGAVGTAASLSLDEQGMNVEPGSRTVCV